LFGAVAAPMTLDEVLQVFRQLAALIGAGTKSRGLFSRKFLNLPLQFVKFG
jgi:hypothetical protein